MSKIKQIKQKTSTGWSDPYSLGADVKNIDNITGIDLEELLYFDDPQVKVKIQSNLVLTSVGQSGASQLTAYIIRKGLTSKFSGNNNTLITESIRSKTDSDQSDAKILKHTVISSDSQYIITSYKRENQNWNIKQINFTYDTSVIDISAKKQ